MTTMQQFRFARLLDGIPIRISCAAVVDQYICVGTNDGKLKFFPFNAESMSVKLNLEREVPLKRGNRKVKQLEGMDRDKKFFFSLCGKHFDIVDTTTLEVQNPLPIEGPVVRFCMDNTGEGRIGILTQARVVSIYSYSNKWSVIKEITLPDKASQIALQGKTLAAAFRGEYRLYNIDTDEQRTIVYNKEPILTAIDDQDGKGDFLLTSENKGELVNMKGMVVQEYAFDSPPASTSSYYPYILSVQPKYFEVHAQTSGQSIQKTEIDTGGTGGLTKLYRGASCLIGYSQNYLYCFVPLPLEDQVRCLIDAGSTQQALDLFLKAGRKERNFKEKIKSFQEYAGDKLFKSFQFQQCYRYYLLSDVDPRRIIGHFPELCAVKNPQIQSLDKLIDLATGGNVGNLTRHRAATASIPPKKLLLKDAKENLMNWLEQMKEKVKKDNNILMDIDYALVRLYAEYKPELLRDNLSQNGTKQISQDIVSQLGQYLSVIQSWNSVGKFHKVFNNYSRAMEIWKKLADNVLFDSDGNPLEEIVGLLSPINDWALIKEHGEWIAKKAPEKLKSILINNVRKPNNLPHELVIKFLEQNQPDFVISYIEFLVNNLDTKEPRFHLQLCELYVTEVVKMVSVLTPAQVQNMQNMEKMLVHSRAKTRTINTRTSLEETTGEADKSMLSGRRKLVNFLRNSKFYDAKSVLEKITALPLREEKIVLYTRLQLHDKALSIIVDDLKDMARAEYYCISEENIMRTDEIAAINEQGGVKYDEYTRAGLGLFSNHTGANPLLPKLLKVFLDSGQYEAAANLLTKYPGKFDPVSVLAVLPPSTPIKFISNFLLHSLKQTTHRMNHAQVVRHIEGSQNMKFKLEKMKLEENHVTVTRETTCPVTGALIGDKPFARYPNGVVVSLAAGREFDLTKCPVSGRDFKTKPWNE